MAGTDLEAIVGQRLDAGPASLARFARLLGVDVLADRFPVTRVSWVEDHLEVRAGPQGSELTFHLRRAVPGEPAFLVGGDLALSYSGGELPPVVGAVIRRRCGPRLARTGLDDMAHALRMDPDLAPAPAPRDPVRPAGQLDSWAVGDTWADFFAAGELARARLDSLDPKRLFLAVQHCDAECAQSAPHGPALVSAVDFPWDDRVRRIGTMRQAQAAGQPPAAPFRFHMITDLDEQDVVRGNPAKLREFVEYAISAPNPEGRTILFSNTCLPAVTGEDVESVVRELAPRAKVPVLYLTVTPRSMKDLFGGLVEERRRSVASGAARDPFAVNLIGFPDAPATGELSDLLAVAGIRVNATLIPEVDPARIRRLAGAALDVYLPNSLWETLYAQVREGAPTPFVEPPAPYGFARTLAWVEAIAAAVGLDPAKARAAVEERAAALGGEWARARAEAAGHRVGLVLRGRDLHFLQDPADTWGVPLVAALEEAGFGLDLLVLVTDRDDERSKRDAIRSLLADPDRHSVTPYGSLDELRERLAASPCEAVFSAHVFDWRLSEAGKARFSLQHFEPGLAGAIRTARRVAGACSVPFFREFRRFLARTPEGLRRTASGGGP